MEILICNDGCDDTTYTIMEVTKEELKTLIKFKRANNKNSTYQCEPKIRIYKKIIRRENGEVDWNKMKEAK